ncbi:MAG TPA: AI-2E family transporter [Ktedonobacterales bacterium]
MYRHDLIERHAALRLLLYIVTIIAALYAGNMIWSLLMHFGGIILLFFLAWIICFVLQPLATFLENRGLPRLLAVTLIYLSLLGVATGSIILAIPVIHSEVAHVAAEATATLAPDNLNSLSARSVVTLHSLGLSLKDARGLVTQVSDQIPAWAGNFSDQAVATTTALLGAIVSILFDTFVVLILSFYMMLDGGRLMASLVDRLPPSWHADIELLQAKIEASFGGFLRAQLIIAFAYGILTGIVLLGLGQANGLLVAVLAGLILLIPFIGPFLAVVPPALLVVLQSPHQDIVRNLIIVVIAVVVAQQITMKLIAPHVMSTHVGLHPVVLFAALLVGAQEGGVWGALFAAPVAAVMVSMLDVFFQRFQQASDLYPEITPETVASQDEQTADTIREDSALPAVRERDKVTVR